MQAPTYQHPRYTIAVAALAALFLVGVSVLAQSQPAAHATVPVDQTVVRKYLTDARNALSELTELPAAVQLTGEPRTRVQTLITNFNELITKTSDWRASYDKVEASLAVLLASEPDAPADTPTAVGTSGTTPALDPAIRAKLVEFGTHLEQFKSAASGETPSAEPGSEAAPAAPPTEPPPTEPPTEPPTTSPDNPTIDDRPENPPADPAAAAAAESTDVSRDIVLHVEAVEAILGTQTSAQTAATAAAGDPVTPSQTPTGSTRRPNANPNVTLTPSQLDEIKTHLSEIRRLVENK